jgi:predicted Zn-dependent protease
MQNAIDGGAAYYDGTSSRRHQVVLNAGAGLEIIEDHAVVANWPFDSIRRVDGPPGRLRLASISAFPLARLDIENAIAIETLLKQCTRLDVDRGGPAQTMRIVVWSIAAVCSILGVIVYGIPLFAERMAPLIPHAVEQRIGDAVAAQVRFFFGDKTCDQPDGRAAFVALVEKVRAAGGITQPLDAQVLISKIPNALALPGGKVFVLSELLQEARSPDEIAGILAHELGHVHHRHVMRVLIHNSGSSFLIGLLLGDVFGGSVVIFITRSLLDASYSREAEQQADDFTVAVMHKLGRSPLPMAELLFRITGAQKRAGDLTILNSHPLTEDRVEHMKRHDRPNTGPEILSQAEWRALKAICGQQ